MIKLKPKSNNNPLNLELLKHTEEFINDGRVLLELKDGTVSIENLFNWNIQPEGYDFWRDANENFEIEKLTVEDIKKVIEDILDEHEVACEFHSFLDGTIKKKTVLVQSDFDFTFNDLLKLSGHFGNNIEVGSSIVIILPS